MSSASPSFRLESRSKPPPPPLRIRNSVYNASAANNETLLYDLPTSPPGSGATTPNLLSPTSPTSDRNRRYSGGIAARSPPSRPRSLTPSRPSQALKDDLENFSNQCREWYFNQDERAGRQMTQTLATLPSSQRAPFSRLQASIRSSYHASLAARRNAEFRAHLTSTHPGASLLPHARTDPFGKAAITERHERLGRFIRTWCTLGMPGTKPFFVGLWAIMRLQVIPEDLGGAGASRIDWEIDDAVFMESAGKEFMLDAINVMKGVLAFEERKAARPSSTASHSPAPSVTSLHARSVSQPLPSSTTLSVTKLPGGSQIASKTVQPKRPRAPSDPFIDGPAAAPSADGAPKPDLPSPSEEGGAAAAGARSPPSPPFNHANTMSIVDSLTEFASIPKSEQYGLDSINSIPDPDGGGYMRVWTSPDLRDPELASLLALFPTFITRSTLPRFPVPSASSSARRRPYDLEEGLAAEEQGGESISIGTGTMRLSRLARSEGWKGGWWTRFMGFWRRLFC